MSKSYARFTMEEITEGLGIVIEQSPGLFANAEPVSIREFVVEMLRENLPLAQAIGTEKAKSELLVAPLLTELRLLTNKEISLFSGVEFNVVPSQGLKGVCDFLISKSHSQYTIDAPVIAVVEAKDDVLRKGLPQCIAEMVAARIFNERRKNPIATVYGSVTKGSAWNFIKLDGNTAFVDDKEYSIENPHTIMGILLSMVRET